MPTDLCIHRYGRPADQAPTLLLLHGSTDSGRCWADAVARWRDRFHIVAPDARGHGESPRLGPSLGGRSQNDVMADDAVQIITDLHRDTGRPVLVAGHSMGARVGAVAAARVPALVAGLVLEDPPWWLPEDGPGPWQPTKPAEPAEAGKTADPVTAAEPDIEAMIVTQRASSNWAESELRPWAQAKQQVDRDMLSRRGARAHHPWTPVAQALATGANPVPTLLVTGDGNVLVRSDSQARLAQVAPAIEVVVIAGAGHCVRRDAGDAFHARADPFLAAHAPMI